MEPIARPSPLVAAAERLPSVEECRRRLAEHIARRPGNLDPGIWAWADERERLATQLAVATGPHRWKPSQHPTLSPGQIVGPRNDA